MAPRSRRPRAPAWGRADLPPERWTFLAPASPRRRLATEGAKAQPKLSAVPNTRGTPLPPSGQLWRDQRPKNQPGWVSGITKATSTETVRMATPYGHRASPSHPVLHTPWSFCPHNRINCIDKGNIYIKITTPHHVSGSHFLPDTELGIKNHQAMVPSFKDSYAQILRVNQVTRQRVTEELQ